jgi:hypothetical protein
MRPLETENAYAVTACPPGEHEIPWGRFGGHICAPDVPGAGLPWDLPTAVSAIAVAALFAVFVLWLTWVTISEHRAGR